MTIQTSIQIRDGMTTAFRNMTTAMNLTLNTLEAVQNASSEAIDTASIDAARASLAQVDVALNEIEQSMNDTRYAQDRVTQSVRETTYSADDLWSRVRGIAATIGGMKAIKDVVGLSDEMAQTNARLSLVVDDGGSISVLQEKVKQMADRSRVYYADAADIVAKLSLRAGDAFRTNDETIQFVENLNKQFVIAGVSQEEMRSASLQLTQALGSGVLRGEELNAVFEAAPNVVQTIADYLDVPIGRIRDMASEGKISAEIVKNAFLWATDDINERFNEMPWTWGQVWDVMKSDALMAFDPILQRINDLANSGELEQMRANFVTLFTNISNAALAAFDLIGQAAQWVQDNLSWIRPVVMGIVTAFLMYKTVGLAVAAVNALIAFTASPLLLVAAVLGTIVAGIYWITDSVSELTGEVYSATGIILGSFQFLGASIMNVFGTIWNVLVDFAVFLQNIFADVLNFIGNSVDDLGGSIMHALVNVADWGLSVLQTLAGAVDTLFGSNLASNVQGWRDDMQSWANKTFGTQKVYVERWNADDLKYKFQDPFEAFNSGYDFGKGIDDSINFLFRPAVSGAGRDQQYGVDSSLYDNNGQYLIDNTGDTAANTARMAETLESSDEELKLLREIAERQAINQFTTAEVRVDMTGMTNKIDGEQDIDGMLNVLTAKLGAALVSTAEGVHI